MEPTDNLNIESVTPLISPFDLKSKYPITDASHRTVVQSRHLIRDVIRHQSSRFLVVVGPCSIYNPEAAIDYANRLQSMISQCPHLMIVMRAYFEKPRTTVGWKGYIHDPHLTGDTDIETGLTLARSLLLTITSMGLPVASELLDPIVPQYLADLLSWASIGARTTESQTHREMASGLSMPVGFKNSTEGNVDVAINALLAAKQPHGFLGINQQGETAIIRTKGNPDGHIILRGGRLPNYDPTTILGVATKMESAGFLPSIMVDCSHGNSNKQYQNQVKVAHAILDQLPQFRSTIMGVMIESNLEEGNQAIPTDLTQLKYGVSITDSCIGWDTTAQLLLDINQALSNC